jgi:DNA-binding NarL/FixJ family response regulator
MNDGTVIGVGSPGRNCVKGLRIALVDDSVLMREHVLESLKDVAGIAEIQQAVDVPSGLRLVEAGRMDVLVLDVELPGQSGLDLLKIARRRDYAAVIIMFSIHDHPVLRQKCADMGADFFFHKLTEFERVAEVCHELAERRALDEKTSAATGE